MASIKFSTARGIAVRPRCDRAYKWNDGAKKFLPDDEEGKFELKIALSPEDAQPIIDVVEKARIDAGLKKMKNLPYSNEVDYKTEEETGRILVSFSQNGKDRNGNSIFVPHFDSKGRPLPKKFQLTAGSEIRVQSHTYAYTTLGGGVKLFLDGIQVIKYVERNQVQFDAVEDGFDYVAEDGDENVSDTVSDDVNGVASADF